MKVVIQRVAEASVVVDKKEVASINKGYLLLVGFGADDNEFKVEKAAEKIKNLRIFEDDQGKMNLSIQEVDGEILSVSQFTLYADLASGRRPSFTTSAPAALANKLYDYFNECLKTQGLKVATGIFQAEMQVNLVNDGPVTVILDSGDFKW